MIFIFLVFTLVFAAFPPLLALVDMLNPFRSWTRTRRIWFGIWAFIFPVIYGLLFLLIYNFGPAKPGYAIPWSGLCILEGVLIGGVAIQLNFLFQKHLAVHVLNQALQLLISGTMIVFSLLAWSVHPILALLPGLYTGIHLLFAITLFRTAARNPNFSNNQNQIETSMETSQTSNPNPVVKNRYFVKAIVISIIILLLVIPTFFITNLIEERKSRLEEVRNDVSSKWSGNQTLTGPVLLIPYTTHSAGADPGNRVEKRLAYFLPDDLSISGSITPEWRNRSIYEIIVYNSDLLIEGEFKNIPYQKLNLAPERLQWDHAELMIGISDFKGITERVILNWNGVNSELTASVTDNDVIRHGLSVPVRINPDMTGHSHRFSIPLNLKGSGEFFFTPSGKSTTVQLSSSWQHPDFQGRFIPHQKSISENGFTASWNILDLNRSFPQYWKNGSQDLAADSFGVHLIQPMDSYAQTLRTTKYAILVILLTFAIYFVVEIVGKRPVHAIQYALVGFSLCTFYLLVLSISEYLLFFHAYLIAAGATVLQIGSYTASVFKSFRTGSIFGGFMGLLYGFIYLLIRLEDGALLIGSISLFCVLAAIMFITRKVDWHGRPGVQQA